MEVSSINPFFVTIVSRNSKGSSVKLTHLDDHDRPKMVDVTNKDDSVRIAVANGFITMSQEAYDLIILNKTKKGPVIQSAVIAAIMGAKKCSDLIPMCHPLMLTSVKCDVVEHPKLPGFELVVSAKLTGKTGVEMEALTGVSVGLLTIYDMAKAIDKSMVISDVKLLSKEGGKSGKFKR
jgi:cyclic pyranopterin phosphate synthase